MTQNKDSKRIARCYIRKSYVRKGKIGPASPELQRATLERKSLELGLVPEWYQDVGGHNSGLSDDRPDWQRLMAEMKDPTTAAVLVYSWEFAARSVRLLLRLVDDADALDVRFISASDNIDTRTADGRFQVTILASVNEHYARRTGEKRAASIDYLRRERGRHYGFPPFGTERVERDGERVLVASTKSQPNGTDHDALLFLYELRNRTRGSYRKLMRALNEAGWRYRDKHGNLRDWHLDDVRRTMTLHWIYSGYVVVGRSHHGVNELLNGSHGALLPSALTAPVAHWLMHTRKVGKRQRLPDVYVLSGVLYCACGQRLVGFQARGVKYYQHPTACLLTARSLYRAERIEALVREHMAGLHLPATFQKVTDAQLLHSLADQVGDKYAEAERIAQALERIEYLFVEGKIDAGRYEAMRAEYLAQMPSASPVAYEPRAADGLPRIAESIASASPELFREMVRALYVRIVVRDWDCIEWLAQEWCAAWA